MKNPFIKERLGLVLLLCVGFGIGFLLFNFESCIFLYSGIRSMHLTLQSVEQGDVGQIMDFIEWKDGEVSVSQTFNTTLTPEEQAEALECLQAMTTDMYLVFDHSEKPLTYRIQLQNPSSPYFYPDCMTPQPYAFYLSSPQYEEAFARLLDLAERVRQRTQASARTAGAFFLQTKGAERAHKDASARYVQTISRYSPAASFLRTCSATSSTSTFMVRWPKAISITSPTLT